jgi:prephenate dehydrogenase
MKTNVLIIGLGLIGGSLAKALQRHPQVVVAGYDADPLTARKAYKMGIIHSSPPSMQMSSFLPHRSARRLNLWNKAGIGT